MRGIGGRSVAGVLLVLLAGASLRAADPARAPGENFDLARWKLTLPIDSSGGFTGTAMEVKPIPATYTCAPWFFTAVDGAMVFAAPTTGATTSGSKYPRCELRELTASGTNAAWTVEQGGLLVAECAVLEVPTTSTGAPGRVVIGQIHGPSDELCRLYYDDGQLYFHDDKAGTAMVETRFVLRSPANAVSAIPRGARFTYRIHATAQRLTVSAVHGGVTYSAIDTVGPFWPGKALYFKAGVYLQVGRPGSGAGTVGTGEGRVAFHALDFRDPVNAVPVAGAAGAAPPTLVLP